MPSLAQLKDEIWGRVSDQKKQSHRQGPEDRPVAQGSNGHGLVLQAFWPLSHSGCLREGPWPHGLLSPPPTLLRSGYESELSECRQYSQDRKRTSPTTLEAWFSTDKPLPVSARTRHVKSRNLASMKVQGRHSHLPPHNGWEVFILWANVLEKLKSSGEL